jgi:hypothetical protein
MTRIVRVILAVAAFALAGCNANQAVSPSGQADRARVIPAAILTIPPATHRTTPGTATAGAVEAARNADD